MNGGVNVHPQNNYGKGGLKMYFLLSTYLEDERNKDLTILGKFILRELALVPFIVGESTRTKVSKSPDEECHRCRGETASNIVTQPLEAFTAVIGRPQETVHTNRRRDLVFTSVLRILTKRTEDLITVDVSNESENPHAETNSEADCVEGRGSDSLTSELCREHAVEPAIDTVVHHRHESDFERHGLYLTPAQSRIDDATVSVVSDPHVEEGSMEEVTAAAQEEPHIQARADDFHEEPADGAREGAVEQGPSAIETGIISSEEELSKSDDRSHQSPSIAGKGGVSLNLDPEFSEISRNIISHNNPQ